MRASLELMAKLNQSGIAHIFALVVMSLSIIAGVYLLTDRSFNLSSIFRPKASGENIIFVDSSGNRINNTQTTSVKVKILFPNWPTPSACTANLGDVDGDGEITSADVSCVKRFVSHLPATAACPADAAAQSRMRVDGNQTITNNDANLISKYVAKIIKTFPACEPLYTAYVVLAEDPNFKINARRFGLSRSNSEVSINYRFSDSLKGTRVLYAKFISEFGTQQNAVPFPATIALSDQTESTISPTYSQSQKLNVLVLKYFPLDSSGKNLDPAITDMGDSLASVQNKVNGYTQNLLTDLTNATKYHGYSNTDSKPAINFVKIAEKEYLEAIPVSNNRVPWNNAYRPDYMKMLNRENICDYVDNLGVRQVWVWGYHTGKIEPVEGDQAMGLLSKAYWNHGSYGDVSNSEQTNDLPVCNHSYTLLNYNYQRSEGEAVHDHGHNIESLMHFVDPTLWNNFINPYGLTSGVANRCGDTHNPPNTTQGYDYTNQTQVNTNCEDWHPDGSGKIKKFNCQEWYKGACLQDGGLKYYIWWMQNMPGLNNGLTHQKNQVRNWWEFIADFDYALTLGKGLTYTQPYLQASPTTIPTPTPTPTPAVLTGAGFKVIPASVDATVSRGATVKLLTLQSIGASQFVFFGDPISPNPGIYNMGANSGGMTTGAVVPLKIMVRSDCAVGVYTGVQIIKNENNESISVPVKITVTD